MTASREAGHSSPAFTYQRYAHWIPDRNWEASARLMGKLTNPIDRFYIDLENEEDKDVV